MSNERGSFSLMGLWERQIKKKDGSKEWKINEEKGVKMKKKCHAKWYIHIYKPDPQRRPQRQQMSKCQLKQWEQKDHYNVIISKRRETKTDIYTLET